MQKFSVAGSGLIVMGLYTVLWGKNKEMTSLANDFKIKHIEEFDISKLENGDIELVKNEHMEEFNITKIENGDIEFVKNEK